MQNWICASRWSVCWAGKAQRPSEQVPNALSPPNRALKSSTVTAVSKPFALTYKTDEFVIQIVFLCTVAEVCWRICRDDKYCARDSFPLEGKITPGFWWDVFHLWLRMKGPFRPSRVGQYAHGVYRLFERFRFRLLARTGNNFKKHLDEVLCASNWTASVEYWILVSLIR